jgi:hypothetical protein
MIKPGTSIPARFVGEFEIAIDRHASWDLTPNAGDVALLHITTEKYGCVDYLQIRCALCDTPNLIPTRVYREGGNPTWSLTSRDPVNVEPSVRGTLGPMPDGKTLVCHYFVHGGQFQALGDSTDRGEIVR